MSWNQLVLGKIDHQLLFVERLKSVFWRHIIQRLFCTWSHTLLDNDQSSCYIFFLHSLAVNLDLLDGHLGIFREEHKHLISWIIRVTNNDREIFPARLSLTRLRAEFSFELLERLIQLSLRYQILAIMAHCHYRLSNAPKLEAQIIVIHSDKLLCRANEIRALSTTHRHGWALNFVSKLPQRQYLSQKTYQGVIKRGKYRR